MYGLFANKKSAVISSCSRMALTMNTGSFVCTPACLGVFEPAMYCCPFVKMKFYSPYVRPFLEGFQILMKFVCSCLAAQHFPLSINTPWKLSTSRRKQQWLQFLSPSGPVSILGPAGRGPSVLCCLLVCEPLP